MFIYLPFIYNLLVRQPFIAVQQVDDAAIAETVFLQDVLQDEVVAVGVCPQVLYLGVAPLQAGGGYTVAVFCTGQAVDGGIGTFVVQPLSLVDAGIGWVFARDEGKGPDDISLFVQTGIAVTGFDIFFLSDPGWDNFLSIVSGSHFYA